MIFFEEKILLPGIAHCALQPCALCTAANNHFLIRPFANWPIITGRPGNTPVILLCHTAVIIHEKKIILF